MNSVLAHIHGTSRHLVLRTSDVSWLRHRGVTIDVIGRESPTKRKPLIHNGRKPTARRKARRG